MCYINKIQLSATVCCPIWTGQQPKQIRWCSGLERKAGCSNTSRDRPKSYKKVVTAPLYTHGSRWESHGSSEMTIINGCPVSQQSFRWPYAVPVRVIYTILSTQISEIIQNTKSQKLFMWEGWWVIFCLLQPTFEIIYRNQCHQRLSFFLLSIQMQHTLRVIPLAFELKPFII